MEKIRQHIQAIPFAGTGWRKGNRAYHTATL